MPRVFRKAKIRTCNWGARHRRILESGGCHLDTPIEFTGDDAGENLRRAWKALGSGIIAGWKTPGERPWAWWWFESPQPRNQNMVEADQLHEMGLLSADELISLAEKAKAEDKKLHANPYCAGGLPFRRSWLYWHFIEQRKRKIPEAQQLMENNLFHKYEKDIAANPRKAMAGGVGCTRSRFNYLTKLEQKLLDLVHKSL